jgi:uncharacterized membrane protein
VKRREDLTTPRRGRRIGLGVHYDPDAFGEFSETIARFIGTARFLVFQTVLIVTWIAWNVLAPDSLQFDPWDRGLVLLTLVLSLQAAYAAPLILLAQNRQESRERSQLELDRNIYERTQADTEFLARELSSVRLAMADVVTNEDLDDRIGQLTKAVEHLSERLDRVALPPTSTD